jgi:hypothetical protein
MMMNLLVACPIISRQDIVYVEDIIVVLVVGTIIVTRLTGLRQNPSRVMSRFVTECWITDTVRLRQLGGQTFQRLLQ